jgi:hypothetical protein
MHLLLVLIFASALMVRAEQPVAGRWDGVIKIPEREQEVVVDLGQNENGAWHGSIIMPGLDVKGATLSDVAFKDSELSFAIKSALGAQSNGAATVKLHLLADGKFSGDFIQGGNTAPIVLARVGPAQVEVPPHSTPVAKEMEGEWRGDYEMFGYPRHVTLKLMNRPSGATAQLVVVGKKTSDLPVDLVMQEGDLLTINSHETGISFEGRWQKQSSEIKGTFSLGAVEQPLVLRRAN